MYYCFTWRFYLHESERDCCSLVSKSPIGEVYLNTKLPYNGVVEHRGMYLHLFRFPDETKNE